MAVAELRTTEERASKTMKKYGIPSDIFESIIECNKFEKALQKKINESKLKLEYDYELQDDIEMVISSQVKKHKKALEEIDEKVKVILDKKAEDELIIDCKIAAYMYRGERKYGDTSHYMAELKKEIPDKTLRRRVPLKPTKSPDIPDRKKMPDQAEIDPAEPAQAEIETAV